MITERISFTNFKKSKNSKKIRNKLILLTKHRSEVIRSLTKEYKDSFSSKQIKKYKKNTNFRIIGMGGSSLGARAIYDFLKHKIKNNFEFVDNLRAIQNKNKNKKYLNLIISKSGNTIETIVNFNILIKKQDKNIFITENKKSHLFILAERLKAEIINHNNYIGGRYSVLSEVGMLPADLMGLNVKRFRQFNSLIKNKKFINALINNVNSTLHLVKNKKYNSVIINYDEKSESIFKWYQQLIAESLGKKKNMEYQR